MQHDQDNSDRSATRPRLGRRTRFVGMDPYQHSTGPLSTTGQLSTEQAYSSAEQLISATQKRAVSAALYDSPNMSREDQSTAHLLQLSGMLRPLRATKAAQAEASEEDGYWPLGIQQAGPLPIINLYGSEPFGRTLPGAVPLVTSVDKTQAQPAWQRILTSSASKISLGLLIGLGLLFVASLFVDLPATIAILQAHLSTPQGIGLVLLAGIFYLAGYSIRGLRWKLFLNPISQVGTLKIIELYHAATLLNFLLPIRAGEAAKSVALKRIANIPISQSLPTVAMDKALDLLPALVIIALVPVLGVQMNLQIWLILGLAGLILLGLLICLGLMAWKRTFALTLLRNMLGWLPWSIGNRIEGLVTGFVDALLAGVSRTRIFTPALLLTCLAVLCDGLFAMFAFWAIGYPIPFGTALFGYTVCTLFSVLPMPPGQIGSYQAMNMLVFSALLHLPGSAVFAMSIFAHPWTALLMAAAGMIDLTALRLIIKNAMRPPGE